MPDRDLPEPPPKTSAPPAPFPQSRLLPSGIRKGNGPQKGPGGGPAPKLGGGFCSLRSGVLPSQCLTAQWHRNGLQPDHHPQRDMGWHGTGMRGRRGAVGGVSGHSRCPCALLGVGGVIGLVLGPVGVPQPPASSNSPVSSPLLERYRTPLTKRPYGLEFEIF